MNNNIVVTKALMDAWITKDESVLREHLHTDYQFTGPMMALNGIEECVTATLNCPFKSRTENSELVAQDNTVVHIFDWMVTAPFEATIPTVEVLEFEGDKVKASRLFFDTALFPAEFAEAM